jgi:8-oxo-dGTP pyrophosphatase MutT (NUDIX family)
LSLARPLTSALDRIAGRLGRHTPLQADDPGRTWAAVALVLAPDPDSLLLIRRAERAGDPWSGQFGLPGGRRDGHDADLIATAIRETAEEVGLLLDRSRHIGTLDDVVPRTPVLPPIAVRPFVFMLDARPPLALNREVAAAHWVELAHLLAPGCRRDTTVTVRGQPLVVPAYVRGDLLVWGMTERILASFFQVIS